MPNKTPDYSKAAGDPILRTFSVPTGTPSCFDISGFFTPISLKDQLIRATLVVERAFRYGLVTPDRPLLVIGGGAAGIAAALTAVRHRVPTTLIERKSPLHRLKGQRYFCPVQYDWPAAHWTAGRFPWTDTDRVAVSLFEGSVESLIDDMTGRLREALTGFPGLLSVHDSVEAASVAVGDGGMVDATFRVAAADAVGDTGSGPDRVARDKLVRLPVHGVRYGTALSCAGFGEENVGVGDYRGRRFWRMAGHAKHVGRILICGGGDGALQDFLLFATAARSAKELYRQIVADSASPTASGEPADGPLAPLFAAAAVKIGQAEEVVKRAEIWLRSGADHDSVEICRELDVLHRAHLVEVNALLNDPRVRDRLRSLVRLGRPGAANVSLAHPCTHFSASYALNRFLALLVGKFVESEGHRIFHPGTTLVDVKSDDPVHKCNRDTDECSKFPHVPSVWNGKTCVRRPGPGDGPVSELSRPHDLIVVRYGLGPIGSVFGPDARPAMAGPQILPYGIS